jgi:radical SAM protein with 4Fe4S-binding SPASM domain
MSGGIKMKEKEPGMKLEELMNEEQSNEQWLTNGICTLCRRQSYCSKPCKKNKIAKRRILNELGQDFMKIANEIREVEQ